MNKLVPENALTKKKEQKNITDDLNDILSLHFSSSKLDMNPVKFNPNSTYTVKISNVLSKNEVGKGRKAKTVYSVESAVIAYNAARLCLTVNEPIVTEYLKLNYPAPRAMVKKIMIHIPRDTDDEIEFYAETNPCYPTSKKVQDKTDKKVKACL
jgi:hypothetical protein